MTKWIEGPITEAQWDKLEAGEEAYCLSREDAEMAIKNGCMWRSRHDGMYDVRMPEKSFYGIEMFIIEKLKRCGGNITHGVLRNKMRGTSESNINKAIGSLMKKDALKKTESVHKYNKKKTITYWLSPELV